MKAFKETGFDVVSQNVAVQQKTRTRFYIFFCYFPGTVVFSLAQIVSQYDILHFGDPSLLNCNVQFLQIRCSLTTKNAQLVSSKAKSCTFLDIFLSCS